MVEGTHPLVIQLCREGLFHRDAFVKERQGCWGIVECTTYTTESEKLWWVQINIPFIDLSCMLDSLRCCDIGNYPFLQSF